MKVLHASKYEYLGLTELPINGELYYTFKCIKVNFDPEVLLLKQAKLVDDSDTPIYFDESKLRKIV